MTTILPIVVVIVVWIASRGYIRGVLDEVFHRYDGYVERSRHRSRSWIRRKFKLND